MLLALLLLELTALTLANPFHKYPYVFLLDVGNEELEKVNTEQIRISKQGGSLALRYPAIGNGEDIAHVRVSGIDFGTDLKANIVEGGPGYKFVVLVLMGNSGVNFDAVITIQTVPSYSDEVSLQNIDDSSSNIDNQESAEEDDSNDSAEDLSDNGESEQASHVSVKENAEFTQESSNVYSYAINEALSGYGNKVHSGADDDDDNGDDYNDNEISDNDDEIETKKKDIHVPYKEKQIQMIPNPQFKDYSNDEFSSLIDNQSQELQNNNDYPPVVNDQNYAYENQEEVKTGFFGEYEMSRGDPYNGREVHSRSSQRLPEDTGTIYIEEPGDNDGPLGFEEVLGDDYDDEESRKYGDKNNNNFIDRNDRSAIAY